MVTLENNYNYIKEMIEKKKRLSEKATTSVAVQTGLNDELSISLSHSKKIELYYSKSYKDYVLSFNLGKSKKFIITKKKWLYFRKFLNQIDQTLTK
jgi:hypothetical protein